MTWRGCLECVVLNRSLIIDLYFVMYSTYETWQLSPQLCPLVQNVHDVLEFVHSEFWVIWLKWNRTVNISVCLLTRVPELWLQPVSVWEQIVLNPVKSSCDSFLGRDPSVQDKSAACVSTLSSVVTTSTNHRCPFYYAKCCFISDDPLACRMVALLCLSGDLCVLLCSVLKFHR